MKRHTVWALLIVMVMVSSVCVFGAFKFDADKKVGYVEIRTLFDGYNKTKDVDAVISEDANGKQQERDGLVEEIRRMKDEMVVLAEKGDEKVKKQAEIDQKIKELQAFDEQSRNALRQTRDEKVKEIFDDLTVAIEEYGKQNGFEMIFSDRALVYKDSKLNITNVILNSLNKNYQKEKK